MNSRYLNRKSSCLNSRNPNDRLVRTTKLLRLSIAIAESFPIFPIPLPLFLPLQHHLKNDSLAVERCTEAFPTLAAKLVKGGVQIVRAHAAAARPRLQRFIRLEHARLHLKHQVFPLHCFMLALPPPGTS